MKTLVALLVWIAPHAGAAPALCALDNLATVKPAHAHRVAAAKAESAAPAPTNPPISELKQPQRQERAPKPALPAHLFM